MSTNHEYTSRISGICLSLLLGAFFLLSVPVAAQSQVIYLNPDRNIARGQEAMQEGDYEKAVAYFRKASKGNLSHDHKAIVQNSLCASLYFQGAYEEAQSACTVAIKEDASYWKAYVNRGHARKAMGDMSGALADYCQANDLSPKHVSGAFSSQCEG